MSITIDADTLHKWALDNGYVQLSAITEFVRHQSEPNPEQVVAVFSPEHPGVLTHFRAVSKAVEVAELAIDTAADLFVRPPEPEITLEDILAGLRNVMGRVPEADRGSAGKKFLARFGAERASDFMGALKDKRREFLEAAKEYAE